MPQIVFAQSLCQEFSLRRLCVAFAWGYLELLQFTVSNQTTGSSTSHSAEVAIDIRGLIGVFQLQTRMHKTSRIDPFQLRKSRLKMRRSCAIVYRSPQRAFHIVWGSFLPRRCCSSSPWFTTRADWPTIGLGRTLRLR